MKTWNLIACALLIIAGVATSCADQASCGKGESLCSGLCLPLAACPDTGASGGDGGSGDGDSGSAGAPNFECVSDAPEVASFGDACSDDVTHSDCGCPAPVCAISPGADEGFCTQVNCDLKDPKSCPSGYTCSDFSAFQKGAPPICWK